MANVRYVTEVEMDIYAQRKELKRIETEYGKFCTDYRNAWRKLQDLLEELDVAQAELGDEEC